MALPQAIEEQKKRAEKIRKEMAETNPTENAVEEVVQAETKVEPVVEQKEVVVESVPDSESTPPQEPKKGDAAYWEQRFRVREGMIEKANEKIAQQEAQLKKLQESFDTIVLQQTAQTQTQATPEPIVPVQELTEEEDTILGGIDGHMANAVRKLSSQVIASSAAPAIENRIASVEARVTAIEKALRDEIGGVRTQVETVVHSEEDRQKMAFITEVQKNCPNVPNCVEVTHDPNFMPWLEQQTDDFSGQRYAEIYAAAVSNMGDIRGAKRVARLINEFQKAMGIPPVSAPAIKETVQNNVVVQQQQEVAPNPLLEQISPDRGGANDIPSGPAVVARITPEYLAEKSKEFGINHGRNGTISAEDFRKLQLDYLKQAARDREGK